METQQIRFRKSFDTDLTPTRYVALHSTGFFVR